MSVSPARTAAFDILLRVERDGAYASELLHSAHYAKLSTQDHGLTTELVMGVLRWRSRLDDEIAPASSQPLPKLDLEVLIALRLALYQLRWLERIPARAAIHESVELVKRARKRSAAPFVNAVLRKLTAKPRTIGGTLDQGQSPASPENLAYAFAHPLWLVERWAKQYGLASAARICQYDQSIPTTAVRLRGTETEVEAELIAEGIKLASGLLLASARRVMAGEITKTRAFHDRRVAVQDEASQLIAALVGRGSNILDCCAAPGGKTLAIADRNPGANITAVELHPHRARVLRSMLRSTGNAYDPARNVNILVADAQALPSKSSFDRILADVPCSGTGTLARNPEIKWRLRPADLANLQARQLAILRSAVAHVAAGGRVIYSTCSLEKEENEDVVTQALEGNPLIRVLDCRAELVHLKEEGELTYHDLASLTRGPYLRTLPGTHPCEGFFAAIVEKR